MKLSWQLNLGLQVLLFAGFVFFSIFSTRAETSKPAVTPASTAKEEPRRGLDKPTADNRSTGPYPGSTVDALLALDPDREHLIGISHLTEPYSNAGYHMSPGAPPKDTMAAIREVLAAYDTLTLLQTEVKWVLLVSDYKHESRTVISTGATAKHGLIVINFGTRGGARLHASHLHHELYWRIEKRILPALKQGWPRAKYDGDYSKSRELFAGAPRCYVSDYSTAHSTADRAEIFRAMVSFPDQLRLAVASDTCLAEKVSLLKGNIERYLSRLLRVLNY